MHMTGLPLPLILGALALAHPAQAQGERAAAATATVAHGDLDLATREGVAALDARIRRTARQLCRRVSPDAYLPVHSACRSRAVLEARGIAAARIGRSRTARLARQEARRPVLQGE